MAGSRHLKLCQQRYRSYNVSDNTYQPLDGGPRKHCVTEEREPSVGLPAADRSPDRHASWCTARYDSYRASDNTYQPFSGPRRQCVSPLI
ncbi:BA14K family protein [Rhizobium sp. BK650]|uniref:BA14K family protein n=1 Tax=Rhizobium sp. BK650 TaxID=2586990 RepID=UPI003917B94F